VGEPATKLGRDGTIGEYVIVPSGLTLHVKAGVALITTDEDMAVAFTEPDSADFIEASVTLDFRAALARRSKRTAMLVS
jgi:hypothetical protein